METTKLIKIQNTETDNKRKRENIVRRQIYLKILTLNLVTALKNREKLVNY